MLVTIPALKEIFTWLYCMVGTRILDVHNSFWVISTAWRRNIFVLMKAIGPHLLTTLSDSDPIELGYLALAVTLAGSYVAVTPRLSGNIKQCLPEYRRQRKELLSLKPERLVHQYEASVLMTWETS